MPFRLYSHEIAFHTPYLARLAEEAAEGFAEARERFRRIPRYADLDPARASLVEALEVSAIEHGFADWREMETRMREVRAGRSEERSIGFFHDVEGANLAAVAEHLNAEPDLVNAVASTQKSALHSVGSAEMAELLLERGADPRIETMLPGGTALMHAIIWGWPDVAGVIAGADRAPNNLRVAAGLNDLAAIENAFDSNGVLTDAAKANRMYYRPNYASPAWGCSGKSGRDKPVPYDSPRRVHSSGVVWRYRRTSNVGTRTKPIAIAEHRVEPRSSSPADDGTCRG